MQGPKRFLIVALAVLATGAVATSLVAASSDSPSAVISKGKGFTPGKIAGKWTGGWRNTTFGTRGSIRANVRPRAGRKMLLLADFGGPVFGCNDPPAAPVTLRRGRGKNSWNARGFRFSNKRTQAFGKLSVNYNFRTRVFKGRGSAPPCNPAITYTVAGKLTPRTFRATVKIDLGPQVATSKLSARKR